MSIFPNRKFPRRNKYTGVITLSPTEKKIPVRNSAGNIRGMKTVKTDRRGRIKRNRL